MKPAANNLMSKFTQEMLADNCTFPYFLIRDHQILDIDDEQVLVLLRILHPYFQYGELTMQCIADEFGVSENEARIIAMPFLEKKLIEQKQNSDKIAITGILNCYYEHWISKQRKKNRKKDPAAKRVSCSNGTAEAQLIKDKSHLFRIFEQELGKNLSPLQSEEIGYWLETDKLPPEMIEEALKRAVMQDKRTFAYIKSILKKWRDAGYIDLATVLANDTKPGKKKTAAKQENNKANYYNRIYDKY